MEPFSCEVVMERYGGTLTNTLTLSGRSDALEAERRGGYPCR